jgi:hypothetical protein
MDFLSTNGIIVPTAKSSVRTRVWMSAALFATLLAVSMGSSLRQGSALLLLSEIWWVLPLSASVLSFVVLATATLVRNAIPPKLWNGLATNAYLASGPSLAILGLLSWASPGTSPPDWVGFFMLLLLFTSAGIYYRDSNDREEEVADSKSADQLWPGLP